MNETVIDRLVQAVRGEVVTKESIRLLYSLDASAYQIIPDVIIIPREQNDIVDIVLIAAEEGISVTPRGAGTGLVGGALNTGICIDTKNLDAVSVNGDTVTVGAGTRKGSLDLELAKHGKMLGPNPSVGGFCSIGGMLGHNSGGINSVKYGSMVDIVKSITFVDGTGRLITLPDDETVSQDIMDIVSRIDRSMFPDVAKNACGYALNKIESVAETQKALVGSDGTLGVIVSAELGLVDKPASKILFVIGYDSVYTAMKDCPGIVLTGPSSCEFVDRHILDAGNMESGPEIECMLLVEYDDTLRARSKMLEGVVQGTIIAKTDNIAEMRSWWAHRNAALHHSLYSVSDSRRTPHIIEDAAVPLDRMVDLLHILNRINERYKTSTIMFGHAGSGNIHVRLVMDNSKTATMKKIAGEYCRDVNKIGGTITAEHGDGLASSEFVRLQYGDQNYRAFEALKDLFDPHKIMNPGKKITQKSTVVENLLAIHGIRKHA